MLFPRWLLVPAFCVLVVVATCPLALAAQSGAALEFGNAQVRRTLVFDGKVWRTTAFSRGDGSERLEVASDEFHLLFLDGGTLSVEDFEVAGEPRRTEEGDADNLTIDYVPRPDVGAHAPSRVSVRYSSDGSPWLRKQVLLAMPEGAAVDRLEVERFSTVTPASRGGRGQPVFLGRWFTGLEYPAGHSRHTDGNTPAADSAHFELVGNYSFIDLEGRDKEAGARAGLVRLFHFPGKVKKASGGGWQIMSKTAVTGVATEAQREASMELVFLDYLETVAKKPRVFLHYNNWFDGGGKNLRGDAFVNVWRAFKKVLEPEGIAMHSMVPDNGWQDRDSVWEPSAGQFPGGMGDLAVLGKRLREEGTSLGLWNSIDSTTNNIGWGEGQGFDRAVPNKYFSQYFAHYCLADEDYLAALEKQMRALTKEGQLGYFKHDFNHLCCLAEGHQHLATDRHGHEANVDGMIRILVACRDENPAVYQNLTNWMWFSPWWLTHGDALWMLAGDDGFDKNWPDISMRAMASTDRDVFLWRMWGKPGERPLVPVSRLMTHGIVKNPGGQMQGPGDTLDDWADYVLMHYGRGTQMKEWYITPSAMSVDEWKVLTSIHKWSESRFGALKNAVYVGGRPDEGKAYGYMGWDGDLGVLVARNPAAGEQVLEIPFDDVTWYRGAKGRSFEATSVFPRHGAWPTTYPSGETMRIPLAGYATIALEFKPGNTVVPAKALPAIKYRSEISAQRISATLEIPDEEMARCELLVIGWSDLPVVRVGERSEATRHTVGAVNTFASYARHGMESESARPWEMAGYDLRSMRGESVSISLMREESEGSVEVWLLTERPVGGDPVIDGAPFPVRNGFRRECVSVVAESRLAVAPPEPVTAEQLAAATGAWLEGKAFGVNGGEYGVKTIAVNGKPVGQLPECGDGWTPFRIRLDTLPGRDNVVTIQHPNNGDSYKVNGLRLVVELPGGKSGKSNAGTALTSVEDWTHREGAIFESATSSGGIPLSFPAP